MTGFRMGYACGPKEIIDAMMKTHQYAIMCASIIAQEASIEALKNGANDVVFMREKYQERRDFIVRRFNEMGMTCHLPKGTFYAFPNIEKFGLSSLDFAKMLVTEAKVAMVPGTAFGESGEGYLRASFATSFDNIVKATDRVEETLKRVFK